GSGGELAATPRRRRSGRPSCRVSGVDRARCAGRPGAREKGGRELTDVDLTENWCATDVEHMRSALGLATQAASSGEVPVGAVVVAGGRIVRRRGHRLSADRGHTTPAE